MNLHLLQRGYPLTIIEYERRERYLSALRAAQSGEDPAAFIEFLTERVETSLERYLRAIEIPYSGKRPPPERKLEDRF